MKRSVEVSGKSLEEVLERASRYFDVPKEKLNYEVISENKGFLGILVPKIVKVRVWVDENEEASESGVLSHEEVSPPPLVDKPQPEVSTNLAEIHGVAIGFLEELFNRMRVKVTVTIHQEGDFTLYAVDGEDAGVLIGRRGETLEALGVLLRTFLNKKGLEIGVVELDVAGYKKKREETLRKLAERVAQRVVREKKRVKLEPMNARERRIIHTALKEHPQVITYSVGTEPTRRVVVELKNAQETKKVDWERKSKNSNVSRNNSRKTRRPSRKPRNERGSQKNLEE
ncbi:MAG: RNA-binding cell elongation regulator Jag/EloR [Candidatus Caldatribacteriaceae bacterium]